MREKERRTVEKYGGISYAVRRTRVYEQEKKMDTGCSLPAFDSGAFCGQSDNG